MWYIFSVFTIDTVEHMLGIFNEDTLHIQHNIPLVYSQFNQYSQDIQLRIQANSPSDNFQVSLSFHWIYNMWENEGGDDWGLQILG
jgi:hypothetical protein